ncbi:MAG: FumA C-terminus/TtdB family hydratase beta subunit [Promethearchaeota archaeon]
MSTATGKKVLHATVPLSSEFIWNLRAGDTLFISGTIVTGRDAVHGRLLHPSRDGVQDRMEALLKDGVIYHCGPVARQNDVGTWEILAAGPTTSARMNSVENDVIKKYGLKAIIGKGGMSGVRWGDLGAVYLAFIGGAALIAKNAIQRVVDVYWIEEFGTPEAAWIIEVKDFGPLIVAQDTRGNNLYMTH